MRLLDEVAYAIDSNKLIPSGAKLLVAVSGGPDSVCLFHTLRDMAVGRSWQLAIGHVNHGFRGAESDEEELFVRQMGERYGVEVEAARLDVPRMIEETRLNPQDAARKARYAFLVQAAVRQGADCVVLAHHADDQAETVLMRLLRGSGPAGLAGIPQQRIVDGIRFVRPLLGIRKEEIRVFLHARHYPYRVDSSNADPHYTRNQIRLEILPLLERIQPQVGRKLTDLADVLRAEDLALAEWTKRWGEEILERSAHRVILSRNAYLMGNLALQRRMIKLILDYLSYPPELVDFRKLEVLRLAIVQENSPNADFLLGGNFRFKRSYDLVVIERNGGNKRDKTATTDYELELTLPDVGRAGTLEVPEGGCRLIYEVHRCSNSDDWRRLNPDIVAFDADQLHFPLKIRNRRSGDRMRVLGLNGRKKVKDMFIDHKVPLCRRERIPLVADSRDELLWIPGLRRSEAAKIREDTRLVMMIRVEWDGDQAPR